jgi:hypothetical protein
VLFKYAPIPVFLASSSVLKLKLVTHEAYMLDRDVFWHAWMLFDLILYFESVEVMLKLELGVVFFSVLRRSSLHSCIHGEMILKSSMHSW